MKTSGKSWARYIDKSIKAKKVGYRKSSVTGERYYEARPDHSDENPKERYADGGKILKAEKEKLRNLAYQLQNADDGWIKNNHGKFVEMQNEYKKQFKKVYGHSNYTDPNNYAKGGAIYKGDKVRIKDSNKSMVVKDIAKGKKGYVEFSGDKGTYLKGDLDKMAKGGKTDSIDYYEQLAVYVQGVGSIYNGTSMKKAIEKARAYEKKKPNAEITIVDDKYGDEYDSDGNFKNEYAKGGKTKKRKDPPIVRGYFDDEPYEYGNGGLLGGFNYSIGGL